MAMSARYWAMLCCSVMACCRAMLWALLLGAAWGCTAPHAPSSLVVEAVQVGTDAPRRAGMDAVLVFLPASAATRQAWQSLRDELGDSFDVVTREVSERSSEADLEREIRSVRPRCLMLLGNSASNLYLKYQQRYPGPYLPAVVLMTSFFEQQYPLFQNVTGVSYEVPGITTFVNLRTFVYRPIQRVGVLYRHLFQAYVERQARLASQEQIQLVPIEVSRSPGPHEIRKALDRLIHDEQVDALWVLNDNMLLKPELIAKGWLKILHNNPIAVVVGVGSLVDARLHFGSFAMLPDHAALGVQAANLVFRLRDETNWDARALPPELPLSIQSVVDLGWTRAHLQFREDAIDRIDRIVE
jgi:hypothetical protein